VNFRYAAARPVPLLLDRIDAEDEKTASDGKVRVCQEAGVPHTLNDGLILVPGTDPVSVAGAALPTCSRTKSRLAEGATRGEYKLKDKVTNAHIWDRQWSFSR
jgi:hypothetical protein